MWTGVEHSDSRASRAHLKRQTGRTEEDCESEWRMGLGSIM